MATKQVTSIQRIIRKLADRYGNDRESDRDLLRRFARHRDEDAFAALVRRHGAMVRGVGLRVLHRHQDAEDICQATFLLLARKINVVSWRESVANWLYSAAYHLALQARDCASRRNAREIKVTPKPPPDAMADITLRELQTVLDEELTRLPRKYRAPILLCCLEGKARDEAAKCLGWTPAILKSRLEEGRELLRRRLARRGLTLAAMLAGVTLTSELQAALPTVVVRATSRAALQILAGQATADAVSANVTALIQGAVQTMFVTKLKITISLMLLVGILTTGFIALAQNLPVTAQALAAPLRETTATQKSAAPAIKEAAKAAAADQVFFARYILRGPKASSQPQATTDAEGRFLLRISRTGCPEDYDKAQWMRGAVVARGDGFAPGWVGTDNAEKLTNVTVQLGRDVPIEGRAVDLQGKPIAGIAVHLRNVYFRQDGAGLKDFVEALQSKQVRFGWWNHPSCPSMMLDPALLGLTAATTTGADGRFRLAGVSGECLVLLRFEGPTIETSEVYAMTRPGPTIHLPPVKEMLHSRAYVFHGATFDHVAAPTRAIVGTVRDKDTGKPLPGVTIRDETNYSPGVDIDLRVTTDAEGRYRMVGLSRDAGHSLLALPPSGSPYLRASLTSGTAPGLDPVTVDFNLKRGVIIHGRVTDKKTNRPAPALVTKAWRFAQVRVVIKGEILHAAIPSKCGLAKTAPSRSSACRAAA
jgi:RNA polymerase sigma factor (sigma-70 family)